MKLPVCLALLLCAIAGEASAQTGYFSNDVANAPPATTPFSPQDAVPVIQQSGGKNKLFRWNPNGTLGTQVAVSSKTGPYQITGSDSGTYFDNTGAVGLVPFTLPPYLVGLHYCFVVMVAQILEVIAPAGASIAIGASNSTAGGNIQANTPYIYVCLVASSAPNQWITDRVNGTWTLH